MHKKGERRLSTPLGSLFLPAKNQITSFHLRTGGRLMRLSGALERRRGRVFSQKLSWQSCLSRQIGLFPYQTTSVLGRKAMAPSAVIVSMPVNFVHDKLLWFAVPLREL